MKKCQDPAILLWKRLKNGLLYVSRPQAKVCNRHNKAQDATASKTDATTATQATTTASNSKSVADKYNLTITSDLSLKQEDENDTVKAMQLRLYNIGYIADKDNVTGYYGEVTAEAVKKFQKNNGLKETGTADNATLVLLFDSFSEKSQIIQIEILEIEKWKI